MMMIPIFGLVYFTIGNIVEKREIVNQMDLLQELSEFAIKSSALVHELQKERGMSAGFLGSQGSKFSSELKTQRFKTDKAIKEFNEFMTFNFLIFSHQIQNHIKTPFVALNLIESKRDLVNKLTISVETELQYYTNIISLLLKNISYLSTLISHAKLSNQIVGYVALLEAKEKAGIERAILNNVFSQNYFTPDMYKKFILLVEAQENYLKNFFFFSTHRQKQLYQNAIMRSQFLKEVKNIRKIAFSQALKLELVAQLHDQTGYGGLIHHFKNYILRDKQQYIDAFHQQYQYSRAIFKKYKEIQGISSSDIKHIEIVENTFDVYKQNLAKAIVLKNQQKSIKEIDTLLKIDDAPAIAALSHLLDGGHLEIEPTYWWELATKRINLFKEIEDQISSNLQQVAKELKEEAKSVFAFSLMITGEMILLTLLISYFFARGITMPLKELVKVAHKISSGDRNVKVPVNSKGETGELSNAMGKMLGSITHSETMLKKTNQSYERFVPDEFLQLLNKNNILDIQLGHHLEINMTILFSDIRSFTTISEKMSPQQNFDFINAYLSEMGPIIRQHHGFVDKYIGDAIMALFTKADDALNAAISMVKIQRYQGLETGIGINTGQLMLGIIGEGDRLQCTVISDAVNLASRLESTTKVYQVPLLISQNTFDNLIKPSQHAIRFIDKIKVKGRSEQVDIFEVFESDPKEIREGKLLTLKTFEEAVHLHHIYQFGEVNKLMQTCLHKVPNDTIAKLYLQRCQNFLKVNQSNAWEEISKAVEWTLELSVNNQTIDKQHQELFFKIKNLIISIGNNKTEGEVGEIIHFLESYVIIHFEMEERYMKQYDYPQYSVHKAKHVQFIENLENIKKYYMKNGSSLYLTLRIQDEIVEWFIHHIGKMDKQLGLFLNQLNIEA
ncbi:bacteriohemerythrin [Candidatus Parabeggiatoa sp. HSG14]|uniref:bacteriohemerythrin n=1 Tax=Candidatus Parabeggiatoa sp. HSG14 TaxID=3055593 RepID=UPI0032E45C5C